jgi:crotonobetainyl-CoA:carnitine CoA-transferase CaiB-like acyl-CoA transferase
MNQMYRSRTQSEAEASCAQTPRNKLLAGSLADLLEARMYAVSAEEVARMATRYGVDVGRLESVARFVNMPSVKEGSVVRTVSNNGNENITMLVCAFGHSCGRRYA